MRKNIVRAMEILKYVYGGMKVPEERVQIAGAMLHLEKALSDQYVCVVCYNNVEDGEVNFDVTESKQDALKLIAEWAKELDQDPVVCGLICKEYDEEGDMTYFALKEGRSTIYECFLRKEKIQ